ncbi:MAG: hypothetical protein HEQ35_05715 [Gloeotrichia echinulata IR180]
MMKTFTLQQFFGENASQTATTLTISKVDLTAVGLTPTAVNTAESLLTALILKLMDIFSSNLADDYGVIFTDETGNAIEVGDGNIYENYFCEYWRSIITIRQGLKFHNHQILVREYRDA